MQSNRALPLFSASFVSFGYHQFRLREETPCGVTTNAAVPCQTKPIREECQVGSGKWQETRSEATASGSLPALGPEAGVPNKPNLASGDGTPKRDPWRLGTHARPTWGVVRNEANFRRDRAIARQSRWRVQQREGASGNKQSPFGAPSRTRRRSIVRNKANSIGRHER